jgi:hypothetical protein
MPNPLSKILPGRPHFFLSHDAIFDEPELALEVMAVITLWSHCEYMLATWLAQLLRTESRIAYGMLNALSSSEARRAALDGAAKAALSNTDFALYERVSKETRVSRNLRNRFVHGLWGSMPDRLPNHLLLVKVEDMTDNIIDWSKRTSAAEAYPRLDYSNVEVYTAQELENARLDAEFAMILTAYLVSVCSRRKSSARARQRRELLSLLATSPTDRRKSLRRSELAPQRRLGARSQAK